MACIDETEINNNVTIVYHILKSPLILLPLSVFFNILYF